MTSESILFRKNFAIFIFFGYYLPSLIKKEPHITLWVFEERTFEHVFESQNITLRLRQRFLVMFN